MRITTAAERAAALAQAETILWPGRGRSLTREEQETFDGLLDGITAFDRGRAAQAAPPSDPRDGVLAAMRAQTHR